MKELKLLKFIKEHNNWEELLTKDPYNLKISRDNGYIMFKYNQLSSDFSIPEVREARGIIFRESDWKCVCHAFDKFMNAEEPNSDLDKIDWNTASVQEKVDGSIMKVWYDNGWNISTNGVIDAFKAPLECEDKNLDSYGKLFIECLHKMGIDEHDFFGSLCTLGTYIFEMVSPYNRVVIDYNEFKIYLLGIRDNETNEEFFVDRINMHGVDGVLEKLWEMIPTPKRYKLTSYEDVVKAANELNPDNNILNEGFVVCDDNFNRVKVKSFVYVKAHRLGNGGVVSDLKLIDLVLQGEEDEFLAYVPSCTERVNKIKTNMLLFRLKIKFIIKELKPETYNSRKEYAEVVKTYPKHYQQFLFRYDKLDDTFNRLMPSKWKQILEASNLL